MAIATVDVKATVPFTLPDDKGEKKTVFHLGVLRSRAKMALAARVTNPEDGQIDKVKMLAEAVDIFLVGVKRIENYRNPQTQELETVEAVTEDHIDQMELEDVGVIAAKIIEINFIRGDQRKN